MTWAHSRRGLVTHPSLGRRVGAELRSRSPSFRSRPSRKKKRSPTLGSRPSFERKRSSALRSTSSALRSTSSDVRSTSPDAYLYLQMFNSPSKLHQPTLLTEDGRDTSARAFLERPGSGVAREPELPQALQ